MSDWIKAGIWQSDLFMDDNEGYIECLITLAVPIKIMMLCYHGLIYEKSLVPINKLSDEERSKLWEEAKVYAKGRLDKNQLINLCCALHCLKSILNS